MMAVGLGGTGMSDSNNEHIIGFPALYWYGCTCNGQLYTTGLK
jgi:hypothetical protein